MKKKYDEASTLATDALATTTQPDSLGAPTEEPAALALREAFAGFHQGTATRTTLTDQDRTRVEAICELAAEYGKVAREAWTAAAIAIDSVVDNLTSQVQRFAVLANGTTEIQVKNFGTITVPAVEHSAVRSELGRIGDQVLVTINQAIEAGRGRLMRIEAARVDLEKRLEFWLQQSLVRDLTIALVDAEDGGLPNLQTAMALAGRLSATQDAIRHRNASAPEKLPATAGRWRTWLPRARAILNEQRTATAA
jgi:hypothetical protein